MYINEKEMKKRTQERRSFEEVGAGGEKNEIKEKNTEREAEKKCITSSSHWGNKEKRAARYDNTDDRCSGYTGWTTIKKFSFTLV